MTAKATVTFILFAFGISSICAAQNRDFPYDTFDKYIRERNFAQIAAILSSNKTTPSTWTERQHPLVAAIKGHDLPLIKVLLDAGIAQYSEGNMDMSTSLLYFPISENDLALTEFLLSNGYKLGNTHVIAGSRTELAWAIDDRKVPIVKLLIRYGADPSEPIRTVAQGAFEGWQSTPLIRSVEKNQLQVAEILLQSGADPNGFRIKYDKTMGPYWVGRKTALDIAIKNRNSGAVALLRSFGAEEALSLLKGYRLSQFDRVGLTSRYVGKTKSTTTNLRVRDQPDLHSSILFVLPQDQPVYILSSSEAPVTIDGIRAYWHFITTDDGKTGWTFGGYLLGEAMREGDPDINPEHFFGSE